MVLSAREILLQNMKSRLETRLPDLCTISRYAKNSDSMGAPTGVPEIIATDIACRVIGGNSDIEDIGDQHALTESYTLIVPVGTQLGVGYIVTLADGTVYQVIDLITRRSEAMDAQALIKREVH